MLEVVTKDLDGLLICPLSRFIAKFPFNGWKDETFVCISNGRLPQDTLSFWKLLS